MTWNFGWATAGFVVLLGSAAGSNAACPPVGASSCVDLQLAPRVSQQIAASERLVAATLTSVGAPRSPASSGVRLDVTGSRGRTATLGYRWATD